MPYDTVHLLVKITWPFSRNTVLSQQIWSVLFKPHISCDLRRLLNFYVSVWAHAGYCYWKLMMILELNSVGLGCKHVHFLFQPCSVCFHGRISEAGGRVLEGGLQSGSGRMKKRRGNFYLAHFSVRTLWAADSSNTVLFVSAVCSHNHNNSGVCSCVSSHQNTFSFSSSSI